jgi:hypothetical protein
MRRLFPVAAVVLAVLVLFTAPARADFMTIDAVEDAVVKQASPDAVDNTNILRIVAYTDQHQRALVKFDLSTLPAGSVVTRARFRWYNFGASWTTGVSPVVDLFHVADDTWSETNVTWNTQPSSGATLGQASVSLSQGWKGAVIRDTDLAILNWDPAGDLADGFLSFVMVADFADGSRSFAGYATEIGTTHAPKLELTYEPGPVPEPTSVALFALGGLGVAIRRRRRCPDAA